MGASGPAETPRAGVGPTRTGTRTGTKADGLIDEVKNRLVRVSDRLDEVDRKRSKGHDDDESEDQAHSESEQDAEAESQNDASCESETDAGESSGSDE